MTTFPPKPIRLWITPSGSNPWKVVFLLEELGLNYEVNSFRHDDVKKAPFINVNPNGRVPAIEDPNTDLTLWESGAICQYLIEEYDTGKRLTHTARSERHLCNQYLHFQMSGQGPYFGQCGVFSYLFPQKHPDVIERYVNEIQRVLGVLEGILASKAAAAAADKAEDSSALGSQVWLVGGKMTYADMSFVSWNARLADLLGKTWDEIWAGLAVPHVRAWHERMVALPSWGRSMALRAKLMDDQGLQWNGMPKGIKTFKEYEDRISAGEDTTTTPPVQE